MNAQETLTEVLKVTNKEMHPKALVVLSVTLTKKMNGIPLSQHETRKLSEYQHLLPEHILNLVKVQ